MQHCSIKKLLNYLIFSFKMCDILQPPRNPELVAWLFYSFCFVSHYGRELDK